MARCSDLCRHETARSWPLCRPAVAYLLALAMVILSIAIPQGAAAADDARPVASAGVTQAPAAPFHGFIVLGDDSSVDDFVDRDHSVGGDSFVLQYWDTHRGLMHVVDLGVQAGCPPVPDILQDRVDVWIPDFKYGVGGGLSLSVPWGRGVMPRYAVVDQGDVDPRSSYNVDHLDVNVSFAGFDSVNYGLIVSSDAACPWLDSYLLDIGSGDVVGCFGGFGGYGALQLVAHELEGRAIEFALPKWGDYDYSSCAEPTRLALLNMIWLSYRELVE